MRRSFLEKLLPAPLNGGFRLEDAWVWCGSVVRGDDKRYHMFASSWERSVPFSPNWVTNSMVVHAVSDCPEGPYAYLEDVLPPRGPEYWDGMMTHNPTIHRYGDKYLLFYTGTTYKSKRPSAGDANANIFEEARRNQRVGLAVAPSPNGPWTRSDAPCLDVRPDRWDCYLTTNPAPCVLPNGEIHLLYKSTSGVKAPILYGAARASSIDRPFKRIGPSGPIMFRGSTTSYEDAYLWMQDGRFNMLFNDMTGAFTGEDHAGAMAVSKDGVDWTLADPPKAYSRTIRWDDGTTTNQGSFERPQLLIQDGVPTHLFAATGDGPGGFWNSSRTWNMVVPLLH